MMLELVEVKTAIHRPDRAFLAPFPGAIRAAPAQSIHRLEHDKLGEFEIFLTAVGAEPQGIVYESVFHRFRKSAPADSKA